jgi:hypothetical protein
VNQADVEAIWGAYLARNGMSLVDNLGTAVVNSNIALGKLDAIAASLAAGNGGGGLTEDQVRDIVREELDKTRLISE